VPLQKQSILIVLFVFLTLLVTGTAFANQGEKVLFQADEITDLNILRERAEKRITDDTQDINRFKANLKNATGDTYIKNYATTQKLKEVKREDGIVITSYAVTVFSDLKEKKESDFIKLASLTTDRGILLASNGSWNDDDITSLITHVATYYYSQYRDGNNFLWVSPQQMTNVRWIEGTDSCVITSARYGCEWSDRDHQGNNYAYPDVTWIYDNTYSRPDPGVGYIDCTSFGCHVVFEQRDQIQRYGSTWEFVTNMIWGENWWG